jgi:glutaminase
MDERYVSTGRLPERSDIDVLVVYETSGDWLYDVGLPGKSGIGGGIVTVAPGKGGLGTFAPLLDGAGNSVKGQLVARFLSRRLGLDPLGSEPVR